MRRFMTIVSGIILATIFSLAPVRSQSLAQTAAAMRQEPARQEQIPAETQPLSEREKMELRGDLHMARKQYPEAIGVYTTILQEEPKNAVLMNKIGIAYHQLMKLDQAKKYYQRAIKADKTYANAVNNLGTVEYNRKKYRSAIKHYRRALAIAPEMATTHSNLGYAYFAEKKFDEALASFRSALAIDPQVFDHKSNYGSVLQDRSVVDRAFFYFFLSKSFALQGNAERCAHYLRKARDEGYKNIASITTDDSFSLVIQDPLVQEVLAPATSAATAPAPKPEP